MGKTGRLLILFVILVPGLQSCFEEDQPVPPYVPPADVEEVSLEHSLYTHQSYFSMEEGLQSAVNENSSWELGFEAAPEGWHIRVNSADLWAIARTGSTNLDSNFTDTGGLEWLSDKSDGNPDSTAVGSWMNVQGEDTLYPREVMILGQYDGISYQPWKKLQFLAVDEGGYLFAAADPGEVLADTFALDKDADFQYMQFSLRKGESGQSEPEMHRWDLKFGQYFTILYTDEGEPTPYYVRGVLSQTGRVEIGLDTLVGFEAMNRNVATTLEYSGAADALGYDWKAVTVDEATNSAEYRVRPNHTYILRIEGERYYKLRFKSFYNEQGLKGYASFEYVLMEYEND